MLRTIGIFLLEAVAYRDLIRLNGRLVHYVYVDRPLGIQYSAHNLGSRSRLITGFSNTSCGEVLRSTTSNRWSYKRLSLLLDEPARMVAQLERLPTHWFHLHGRKRLRPTPYSDYNADWDG